MVASSVSAVISADLRGVCAYMQKKVRARLIAFEQGGFRGDYSVGLREAYRLVAQTWYCPQISASRASTTYLAFPPAHTVPAATTMKFAA